MEKSKNIIISCIYRTPGTSIEIFTNWIDSMFSKFCNKVVVFCGDFNIDLLNPSNYSAIDTFINTMYSVSLFPKITRPSRITSYSATLIDNIFTNHIENKSESGLLIKDITDHLPVFVVYNGNYKITRADRPKQYKRTRTEESIKLLNNDLGELQWEVVYEKGDSNSAYDTFMRIVKTLYDKNCPVKEWNCKKNYTSCPWITF